MVVQSGVSFDAFGLEFLFGHDGYHVRDLFKISSLIDRLANLGKPLHVSAVTCPSGGNSGVQPSGGGQWHAPWSDEIQAEFMVAFLEVALSKPYVESVCLAELADGPDLLIPTGGVLQGLELQRPLVDLPAGKVLTQQVLQLLHFHAIVGNHRKRIIGAVDGALGPSQVKALFDLSTHAIYGIVYFHKVGSGDHIERRH